MSSVHSNLHNFYVSDCDQTKASKMLITAASEKHDPLSISKYICDESGCLLTHPDTHERTHMQARLFLVFALRLEKIENIFVITSKKVFFLLPLETLFTVSISVKPSTADL